MALTVKILTFIIFTFVKVNNLQNASGGSNSTPAEIQSGRAKAWIKFSGATTGAILGSYGISSISNPSTGQYTITFSTAFANTNYAVVACSSGDPAIHRAIGLIDGGSAATVTLRVSKSSTGRNIYNGISVPVGSSLVLVDRNTAMYLEENDLIYMSASADNDLTVMINYEEIS